MAKVPRAQTVGTASLRLIRRMRRAAATMTSKSRTTPHPPCYHHQITARALIVIVKN